MGMNANDIATDAFTNIQTNYDRHAKAGIPRWDLPGTASGGLWMETHSSRCLDNNSVLHPAINIIEGIYGREGPFVSGPSDNGGYGKDLMTNVIIFGKNARHVDLIGIYLAGHEPGDFAFFTWRSSGDFQPFSTRAMYRCMNGNWTDRQLLPRSTILHEPRSGHCTCARLEKMNITW